MDVGNKLPHELLSIIETYTRRPQPNALLDDIQNCVYYLNQLERKNKEIRKIYMVIDNNEFKEVEVKKHNNYYRSIENYVRYACELYPYYSEYESILRRCYYGQSHYGKHNNQYHKWRNGYESIMKYMYAFEDEDEDNDKDNDKDRNEKLNVISRDEKSKRLCRMMVSLCTKEERDKLFCNLDTF
jgi:hypothetical protein